MSGNKSTMTDDQAIQYKEKREGPWSDEQSCTEESGREKEKIEIKRGITYHDGLPPCYYDIECPICEETFSFRYQRDRHVKEVHSGCERIKCKICDRTFTRIDSMRRHQSTIHERPKCILCGNTFLTGGKMKKHMEIVHKGMKKRAKKWNIVYKGGLPPCYWDNECPTCKKPFYHKRERDRHIKEFHLKNGRVKCTDCVKTFTRQETMMRHQSRVHTLQCHICKKSFNQKENLVAHEKEAHVAIRRVKSVRKNIVHHTISTKFGNDDALSSDHVRRQALNKLKKWKRKNAECSICDLKFSNVVKLNRHIQEVHTGLGKICCPQCDQVFTREENMLRHKKRFHYDHSKSYKCDTCHKLFTRFDALKRHEKQVHSRSRLKCEVCPATFARQDKLEKHLESGKHYLSFYCPCCQKIFTFKTRLALENHVKARFDRFQIVITCVTYAPSDTKSRNKIHLNCPGGEKDVKESKERIIRDGLEKAKDESFTSIFF